LKKKVMIPAVLLISGMVAATALFLGTGKKEPPSRPLKVVSDTVDVEVKDILYTETGDGKLTWEIKAEGARYLKGANLVAFDTVKVTLLTAGGRKYILSGDKAEFRTDTKDMKITGRVRMLTDRGDVLKANRLQYANSQKRIFAEGPVSLESGRMQVSGEGLNFNVARQEVSLLSNVRAEVR
jgi:LPS export ABC transporter protein LptC